MDIMTIGGWNILALVMLFGYIFLILVVCSIVYLDNILPRIPKPIDASNRTRAKNVSFSSISGKLNPFRVEYKDDFGYLIDELSEHEMTGGVSEVRRLYNSGKFIQAINLAASITKKGTKKHDAMRLLAKTLDRIGEKERSVIVWDEMAKTLPLDEEIATRRIRIRYSHDEFRLCINACKDLIQPRLNNRLAYSMIGKSLINLGDD